MNNWYAVKCLFKHKPCKNVRRQMYEERIILVRADSFDAAAKKSKIEADSYSSDSEIIEFIDILNVYELDSGKAIKDSQEVYSLMYSSNLAPKRFMREFFPEPKLDDCSVEKLSHRWYRIDDESMGCYHCQAIKKIPAKK